MKKYNMTYHASHDRATRIMDILATLGVGEEIATDIDPNTGNLLHLLNNGCIMVTDMADTTLITMWVASVDRARHFFPSKTCPHYVEQMIKNAQRKWKNHRKSFRMED